MLALGCFCWGFAQAQTEKPPLRIFIRAGGEDSRARSARPSAISQGMDGAFEPARRASHRRHGFSDRQQLAATDVLVMFAGDAGDITPPQRAYLAEFLHRGGGIVAIHDAVAGHDPDWFKTIVGGAWNYGHTKYFEGDLSFYYLNHEHPITRGVSNFDFDDEQYYDMDLLPEANVLAGTYQPDDRNKHVGRALPSIYDVAPLMWTYEKDNHRAFVCIPGHNYKTFDLPHFRAVLLRGIAWAGKRDADSLVSKEELASLRYPVGGPTAPDEAVPRKIFVPPDFNIKPRRFGTAHREVPISMDWDAERLLWIAETPEHAFRKDRDRAPSPDRISILESSRGDGRMGKKTIFYDGLDLVTSLVFYKDGVIVSQPPYILWLRDTKGAGKWDTKDDATLQGIWHERIPTRWSAICAGGWMAGFTRPWVIRTGDIYSGDGAKHFWGESVPGSSGSVPTASCAGTSLLQGRQHLGRGHRARRRNLFHAGEREPHRPRGDAGICFGARTHGQGGELSKHRSITIRVIR